MKLRASLIIAVLGIVLFCSSCGSVRLNKDCGCGSFHEKVPVEYNAK